MKFSTANLCGILCTFCLCLTVLASCGRPPVKVFILAGQSNMVGHGEIEKGEKGNLKWLVRHTGNERFKSLMGTDGKWTRRDDVFIYSLDDDQKVIYGPLAPGYGGHATTIGPELMFGNVVGDHFDEKVLIIKISWGGKSLGRDFLPPSAVSRSGYLTPPMKPGDAGYYYEQLLSIVNDVIGHVDRYVPGYEGEGCQIAGFGWHQGWNDRVNQRFVDSYTDNLRCFINDVRRDLDEPDLPFVMATTGMSLDPRFPRSLGLVQAQKAILQFPEFKGNVSVVDTEAFWREVEDSPCDQSYHWNRNAESYCLIGESMGEAMLKVLKTYKRPIKTRHMSNE